MKKQKDEPRRTSLHLMYTGSGKSIAMFPTGDARRVEVLGNLRDGDDSLQDNTLLAEFDGNLFNIVTMYSVREFWPRHSLSIPIGIEQSSVENAVATTQSSVYRTVHFKSRREALAYVAKENAENMATNWGDLCDWMIAVEVSSSEMVIRRTHSMTGVFGYSEEVIVRPIALVRPTQAEIDEHAHTFKFEAHKKPAKKRGAK